MIRSREMQVWSALVLCAWMFLSVSVFAGDVLAQASSPVFVVYGRMTTQAGDPISGSYTIVVENTRTGVTLQDDLGFNADAGKYEVAFVSYSSSGGAAEVGDIIQVSVKLIGGATAQVHDRHEVDLGEILGMRARVDLIEGVVALESTTWGAIKSLYRLE